MKINARKRCRQAAMALIGVIIGIMVIIIGVLIIVKLLQIINRLLPPTPPPQPPGQTNNPASTLSYAAFIPIGTNWVDQEKSPPVPVCPFNVAYRVTETSAGPVLFLKALGFDGALVPQTEWFEDIKSFGLFTDGNTAAYATNEVAAPQESVPIGYTNGTLSTMVEEVSTNCYTIVLERSVDMSHWTPIFTNSVTVGYAVEFTDGTAPYTTNGGVFYRGAVVP